MLQQITIQTTDAKRLKPLIKSAIQNQLDDIEHGIQLTRSKLKGFEKQYDMSAAQFHQVKVRGGSGRNSIVFTNYYSSIASSGLTRPPVQNLSQRVSTC